MHAAGRLRLTWMQYRFRSDRHAEENAAREAFFDVLGVRLLQFHTDSMQQLG